MSNLAKLAMSLGLKFGPVNDGVTPRRVLEYTLDRMVKIQTSNATDSADLLRNEGAMEAYRKVANFIAPAKTITKKN